MNTLPPRSVAGGAALGLVATLLTLVPSAQAQDPLPLARPSLSPIRSGPTAPDGTTSGLWACGAAYKASFHDGMTFYPYVGPSLPHQPVRWRTTSVRAGNVELLANGGAAAPRASDWRCEYDLGAVIERYDVLDGGVEQSFVVLERPPAGDLVITGELQTPLTVPAVAPHHGPLSLTLGDGKTIVEYGAAIAIDRNGVRTPVTTATDGNRVLLRVAAETVAAASFPLVVDPLLSAPVFLAAGGRIDTLDVLHETLTDPVEQARTWFAAAFEVAAGDRDVWLWRADTDLVGPETVQYREISAWDSTHCRLALAPAADRVVMVFSTDYTAGRFINLHSHSILDNNLVVSSVTVPQPGGVTDWRPDVGGRFGPNGSKVLITFQREAVTPFAATDTSEVWATVFDASVFPMASAFTVPPFVVLQRSNWDQERSVVNQSAGGGNWLLAFQEINNNVANDDWDITTMAVTDTGNVTATGLQTAEAGATNPTLHKIDPDISGSSGRFVLTYTTREFELPNPKPTGVLGSIVNAQRLDFTFSTGTGSLPHPVVQLVTSANNIFGNGGLAFDPTSESHWCAGMRVDGQARYRVSKLGYTGNVVESQLIQLLTGEAQSAIAVSFNQELRTFPIVFSRNDGTATGNDVNGTMMQYVPVTPPATLGFACGSGVWTGLAATGDRARIGAQAMPLRLANAPQDTVALLFVSTGQLNLATDPLGAPGCVLVPDLFAPNYLGAVTATITGGAAALTLDLPEYLAPMQLVLQWAYLVPGANPLGLQASEGLTVHVDR